MKIARFDEGRIGIVGSEELLDVTDAVGVDPQQWPPVGAVQMIAAWTQLRAKIDAALASAPRLA